MTQKRYLPHPGVPSNSTYRKAAIDQYKLAEQHDKKGDKINAGFYYMDCISNFFQVTARNSKDYLYMANSYLAMSVHDEANQNIAFTEHHRAQAQQMHSAYIQAEKANAIKLAPASPATHGIYANKSNKRKLAELGDQNTSNKQAKTSNTDDTSSRRTLKK